MTFQMVSRRLSFSLVKMDPLDMGEARELILLCSSALEETSRCGAAPGAEKECVAAATASSRFLAYTAAVKCFS